MNQICQEYTNNIWKEKISVADPGSGMEKSRSEIWDKQPEPYRYFWELVPGSTFIWVKNTLILCQFNAAKTAFGIQCLFDPFSGIRDRKIRIQDKNPGSAKWQKILQPGIHLAIEKWPTQLERYIHILILDGFVADLRDESLHGLVKVLKVVPVRHVTQQQRLLGRHVDGRQLP